MGPLVARAFAGVHPALRGDPARPALPTAPQMQARQRRAGRIDPLIQGSEASTVRLLAPLLLLAQLSAVPARADSLSLDGTPSPAASFTLEETFVTVTGPITAFRWLPDGGLRMLTKTGN